MHEMFLWDYLQKKNWFNINYYYYYYLKKEKKEKEKRLLSF